MNFSNINPEEEMSMEDILSSIRKYVSEEDEKKEARRDSHEDDSASGQEEQVIKLDESNIVTEAHSNPEVVKIEAPIVYQEKSSLSESVVSANPSKKPGPFDQLTNALNSYGKSKVEEVRDRKNSVTVDQLFATIAEKVVQKWVDENLSDLVEKIVLREIEKMKSE